MVHSVALFVILHQYPLENNPQNMTHNGSHYPVENGPQNIMHNGQWIMGRMHNGHSAVQNPVPGIPAGSRSLLTFTI
jgi:hypothetical protein